MGVRVRERVDISKAMRARLLSAEAAVAKIRFDAQRRHRRSHPVRGGRYGVLEDEAAGAARDSADKEGDDCILLPHPGLNGGSLPNRGGEVRRGRAETSGRP